jgi:hypothetical protein
MVYIPLGGDHALKNVPVLLKNRYPGSEPDTALYTPPQHFVLPGVTRRDGYFPQGCLRFITEIQGESAEGDSSLRLSGYQQTLPWSTGVLLEESSTPMVKFQTTCEQFVKSIIRGYLSARSCFLTILRCTLTSQLRFVSGLATK